MKFHQLLVIFHARDSLFSATTTATAPKLWDAFLHCMKKLFEG